jgi:hypothetical protein
VRLLYIGGIATLTSITAAINAVAAVNLIVPKISTALEILATP